MRFRRLSSYDTLQKRHEFHALHSLPRTTTHPHDLTQIFGQRQRQRSRRAVLPPGGIIGVSAAVGRANMIKKSE